MEVGADNFGALQMHVFFRLETYRPLRRTVIGQAGGQGLAVARPMPTEHGFAYEDDDRLGVEVDRDVRCR